MVWGFLALLLIAFAIHPLAGVMVLAVGFALAPSALRWSKSPR